MKRRWATSASAIAAVIATTVSIPLLVAAQSPTTGAKSTAAKSAYTPGKTPWGDPDLQGSWTTDSAYAIPLQRPAQFAGRADLTDEEFKTKSDEVTERRTRALT